MRGTATGRQEKCELMTTVATKHSVEPEPSNGRTQSIRGPHMGYRNEDGEWHGNCHYFTKTFLKDLLLTAGSGGWNGALLL